MSTEQEQMDPIYTMSHLSGGELLIAVVLKANGATRIEQSHASLLRRVKGFRGNAARQARILVRVNYGITGDETARKSRNETNKRRNKLG